MVISGMRTGKNNTNGMISVAASSSGALSSVPAQLSHQTLLDQNNIVRTRSGREIMRDGGAGDVHVWNEDNGSSSRKRHWKQKSSPQSDKKQRNVFPKRAHYGRRKGPFCVEGEEESSGELSGKRSILFWLIESGTVPPNARLSYRNMEGKNALKQGKITTDGLVCNCCHQLLTMSEFESHAGSTRNDPYRNIFLDTGVNLLSCQIAAWNQQNRCSYNIIEDENETDQNDDTCGTCGDGGDLICCDGCPSTYHQSCIGIEVLPPGDWICPHCKCKFCRRFHCAPAGPLLTCQQCERRFHLLCSSGLDVNTTVQRGFYYCGQKCWKLLRKLKDITGFNNPLENGYSWSLNQRLDQVPKEMIFRQTNRVNCYSKLAIALKVMRECFDPITDPRSGVDIIQSVVYNVGSNLKRLNFTGFYTAILEIGDEIISVASIRIHGTRLAEMPFIGTRNMYRSQGMCDRLFRAIETKLGYLGVDKIIIPSVEERVEKWITEYNFQPIGEALWQEMKCMNLLTFPGTIILEKNVMPPPREVIRANNTDVCHRPPALFDLNQLPPFGNRDDMA